ncbi:hypothetical protein ACUHMQ_20095 [Chitinimonas sp. PSY-7]|uniref:hypothetical protein n=1 Tax=Chitinimonas sp. PSY-7 TaxID=3459088 RepID=UPI0040401F0F
MKVLSTIEIDQVAGGNSGNCPPVDPGWSVIDQRYFRNKSGQLENFVLLVNNDENADEDLREIKIQNMECIY